MTGITNNGYVMNLSTSFLQNIDRQNSANLEEEIFNSYKNKNIYPPLRVYNDSSHLNLIPKVYPNYDMTYKTKQILGGVEKPIQTENDEETVSTALLNRFSGYTDYGNYLYQNQTMPESLAHSKLPDYYKSDLFD